MTTTPRAIPEELVVDVSDMDMDSTIMIGDIALPAGVTAVGEPDWVVVTVLTMRTPLLDEEEAEAEAAEVLEGEAAEGEAAEGEAAPDGDDAGE